MPDDIILSDKALKVVALMDKTLIVYDDNRPTDIDNKLYKNNNRPTDIDNRLYNNDNRPADIHHIGNWLYNNDWLGDCKRQQPDV